MNISELYSSYLLKLCFEIDAVNGQIFYLSVLQNAHLKKPMHIYFG